MPDILHIQAQRRADRAVGQKRGDFLKTELRKFVGDEGVAVQKRAAGSLAEALEREGARVFGGGTPVGIKSQRVAGAGLDRVAPAKFEVTLAIDRQHQRASFGLVAKKRAVGA